MKHFPNSQSFIHSLTNLFMQLAWNHGRYEVPFRISIFPLHLKTLFSLHTIIQSECLFICPILGILSSLGSVVCCSSSSTVLPPDSTQRDNTTHKVVIVLEVISHFMYGRRSVLCLIPQYWRLCPCILMCSS